MADPVYSLAEYLLDATSTAVAPLPQGIPRRLIIAEGGQVAWDECCDGMAWVAWTNSAVGLALDNLDVDQRARCGHGVIVTLRIGILRCAAELNDDGFPSAAAMNASAAIRSSDAWAVLNAIACALSENQLDNLGDSLGTPGAYIDASILGQDPLGPEGGCVGSEITVRVLITAQT